MLCTLKDSFMGTLIANAKKVENFYILYLFLDKIQT